MPAYRCAICDKSIEYADKGLPELFPFCSERCRWVDLGKWFSGEYSIDRDLTPEDLAEHEQPPGRNGVS